MNPWRMYSTPFSVCYLHCTSLHSTQARRPARSADCILVNSEGQSQKSLTQLTIARLGFLLIALYQHC